jgi:hypothetical protein
MDVNDNDNRIADALSSITNLDEFDPQR